MFQIAEGKYILFHAEDEVPRGCFLQYLVDIETALSIEEQVASAHERRLAVDDDISAHVVLRKIFKMLTLYIMAS